MHFDKMDSLIPDASRKIIGCMGTACNYARENGIKTIIQYGDVGDKSVLSYEAQKSLYRFILENEDLDFHFILGNHDFDETGVHSLSVLETVANVIQRNVYTYTKPELVKIEKRRFNMMSHPGTEFVREALNIAHLELANSYRDNGRKVDHGVSTKHAACIGHLHTCHQVGKRAWFSGTMYQTNFGESMPKSFHHVTYDDSDPYSVEVTNVPHDPPWKLVNLEVETESDLKSIKRDPTYLYKLFLKDGLDIDLMDVMNEHPNIVRHNKFKDKTELKTLIENEWDFENASMTNNVDTRVALEEFLQKKARLTRKEVKRSFHILNRLTTKE